MDYSFYKWHKLPKKILNWGYKNILVNLCEMYLVDPTEIIALILTESNGNPWIVRYESHYSWTHCNSEWAAKWKVTRHTADILQKTSFGLCQIMGATFIDLGFKQIPTMYLRPRDNIEAGILYWLRQKKKWGEDPLDCYAAYNAGSCRKIEGRYTNANAVLRYRHNYEKIEKEVKP